MTKHDGLAKGWSRDQMAARVADHGAKVQPVPKAGVPDDIAQAVLYLASDASAFVSGTHLVVDGGITVGSRHAWEIGRASCRERVCSTV